MGERGKGPRPGLGAILLTSLTFGFVAILAGCTAAPTGGGGGQSDPISRPSDDDPADENPDVTDPIDDGPITDPADDDGVVTDPGPSDPGEDDLPPDDDGGDAVAGDLTGDGAVTQADADYFRNALNTKAGEEGFDPALDYDHDETITQVDYQAWFNTAYPE